MINLLEGKNKEKINSSSKQNCALMFKVKKINNNSTTKRDNVKMRSKIQTPANNVWSNSIYSYNNSTIKLLPSADDAANKLIRLYFSLNNKNVRYNNVKFLIKTRKRIIRKKRLFLNKILTSKPEIKHNNNKVIITVYMHDLSKVILNKKIRALSLKSGFLKSRVKPVLFSKNTNYVLNKRKKIVDTYYVLKKKILGIGKHLNIIKKNKNMLITKKYFVHSDLPRNVKFMTEQRKNNFVLRLKKKDLYKNFARVLFSLKINKTPLNNSYYCPFFSFIYLYKSLDKFKWFVSANRYNAMVKLKNKKNFFSLKTNKKKDRYTGNTTYKLRNVNKLFNFLYKTNIIDNGHIFNNSVLQKLFYKKRKILLKKKLGDTLVKARKFSKKINKISELFMSEFKWTKSQYEKFYLSTVKKYVFKLYRKKKLYVKYKKDLLYNNDKLKHWKLLNLKTLISKVYNKKVEINLVNLKYFYLNSDIFSESIVLKLRRKRKLLKILKDALNIVDNPKFTKKSAYYRTHLFYNDIFKEKNRTLNLKFLNMINSNVDVLQILLKGLFKNGNNTYSINDFSTNVLNSIKHKYVFGIRLEAAGRLTRRRTASRSLFKVKYEGNLRDMNIQSRGLPSLLSKGNLNSNVQYTKLTSKTRNGTFGIKGWISSN